MDNNKKAFTLIELIISIFISVILLGGIFYFISDTILGISRASAHARFLKDFYSFTTILDSGNLTIVKDYPENTGYDVAILTSVWNQSGILIGVVDAWTYMLAGTWAFDSYHKTILWYRSLSSSEIVSITSNPNIIYTYSFFWDKLFPNFFMKDFQLQMYNSWSILDMKLTIFPSYLNSLEWEKWINVPKNDHFIYSLTF